MKYFFSKTTLGFYCDEVNESTPADVVEISEELYFSLRDGQSAGKVIVADETGAPVLVDAPEPSAEEFQEKAEAIRQSLLTAASNITTDLKVELQLGMISDEDKVCLTAWMAYTKALKALEFSGVNDKASYEAIVWPATPDS
ncbi:tail fiber assembly protein [Enterobacter kobei]|uniref:tail fiber assembly protein n=1 Tax=Enterobacter kobei TaxID=208224 RepID=UPI003CF3C36E